MKYWGERARAGLQASFFARAALVAASLLIYMVLFLIQHSGPHSHLAVLSLVPVVLVGLLFGQAAGVLGAVGIAGLNLVLLQVIDHASAATIIIDHGGWASLASMLLVGALVGQHHDAHVKLRAELCARQRINAALDSAQASLRSLISSSADGMLVVSQQGKILFMNRAAESMCAAEDGDVLAHISAGQPAEFTLKGNPGVVELRVTPTEWEGQPARLGTLRDITQRKQAEESLRLSEERFRQFAQQLRLMQLALDHVASGVIITDAQQPDNPIIYANPGFENLTGYTAAEVIGINCRFMQRADRDQAGLSEVRAALREKRACQVLLRNYRKDGSPFWNELNIRPVHDSEGQVVYFVGLQHNVTANLENQARLEYLSSHDSLTGLFNRSHFHTRVEAMAASRQLPVTIMVADMDGLKQVNDRWGHASGDDLLRQAGQLLCSAFREQDVVARLGGDEFAVLMPQTNLYQGGRLLESFRVYLDQYNRETPEKPILFSCGLALLSDAGDVERVLHHADMAMYAEKARRKKENRLDL
jgi:diguanylate cyclase (GGDEF)-like protein/PAS domain S-box-containing protein